ncbi:MAG: AraC family transcriptional regulator [Spirochaetaceae bacterium]|jgi:AraC-like DNA-binding protein|nr:AraC family transcriptional regulator [Spirochaetaceae bacterium]
MTRHSRKRSNLREYFFYFLVLSIIVIVFTGSFYFYFSLKTLEETSIRNREESLLLMQNTFENLISQIDNSITLSSSYFQQYKTYYDQGKYTMLLQLHEELNAISRIKYVHNISIYYRDWGYTVSSDLGIASLEYYPDALFLRSLNNADFRYRKMLFRSRLLRNGENITVLTMIRSIPVYYSTEFPDAWVVIDIDLSSLNGLMEEIFHVTDSFFSIQNGQGIPLVSIGNSSMWNSAGKILDYGGVNLSAEISPTGFERMEYEGYLILRTRSPEWEWSFVYIEPYTSLGKDWFGRFFVSAVGVTAIVFFVSLLGSFFFSRRVFNPIKAIFEKTNIVKANNQKLKETDLILQKIDELIHYNNRPEQKKINLEKNEAGLPYPVPIENEIYRAFRDGDWDKFEAAAASFYDYYIEKQTGLEKVQGAYLRLLCASGVFFSGNFALKNNDEGPDYRQIFTFSSIAGINDWMLDWFSRAFNYLYAYKRTQSRLLKDICRYIDTHLGDDITAKGLWRQFNYHPSALHKLFREELHLTLKGYVNSRRIEQARELLLNTNLKVQDIAAQVGYLHTQSFIAFFRQTVHCTPAEYRRQAGGL